jgi:hypothetical protein
VNESVKMAMNSIYTYSLSKKDGTYTSGKEYHYIHPGGADENAAVKYSHEGGSSTRISSDGIDYVYVASNYDIYHAKNPELNDVELNVTNNSSAHSASVESGLLAWSHNGSTNKTVSFKDLNSDQLLPEIDSGILNSDASDYEVKLSASGEYAMVKTGTEIKVYKLV